MWPCPYARVLAYVHPTCLAYMFLLVFLHSVLAKFFSLCVQTCPPSPLHAYKKDARRYILLLVQLPLSLRDICIERIFGFVCRDEERGR